MAKPRILVFAGSIRTADLVDLWDGQTRGQAAGRPLPVPQTVR